MKKTLIATTFGLMLAFSAGAAEAVTILTGGDADPFFLGAVDPGGGSPTAEAADLNVLLTQPTNTNDNYTLVAGVNVNRSDNTLCGTIATGCPTATAVGSIGDDSAPIQSTGIDVTNWTYLKAKYGNTAVYWYVADINDTVNIPTTFGSGGGGGTPGGGGGLSHWLLFNPTPTTVPDGGATLGLLGLAMLGLGYLRRKQ